MNRPSASFPNLLSNGSGAIGHFIPYLGTAMGGPVQGVAAYSSLLAQAGFKLTVYSASRLEDGSLIRLDPRVSSVVHDDCNWGSFRRSKKLGEAVQKLQLDLVHSHGLWTDVHRLAGVVARACAVPHILAPCGMLAPGALRRSLLKKALAFLLFQRRALLNVDCFHAKSLQEMTDIRNAGFSQPVAVIPNPVITPIHYPASGVSFRQKFQVSAESEIILYLGRLHPVKGLSRLIDAWAQLAHLRANARLILAGPDEGGYRAELENQVLARGIGKSVLFTGELTFAMKWEALGAASFLVAPSDFENFGSSIAEALLAGVPVITTTGTPWQHIASSGAGWWIDKTPESLAAALGEAFGLADERRADMKSEARKIGERFTGFRIGQELAAVYSWLLNGGKRPGCVYF